VGIEKLTQLQKNFTHSPNFISASTTLKFYFIELLFALILM